MSELKDWLWVLRKVFQYLLYRMGLRGRPFFRDNLVPYMTVVGRVLRWPSRLRVLGVERCPKDYPAVYAGNHMKLDDPCVMFRAAYVGSGGNCTPFIMMRDDFFGRFPKVPLIDLDEVMRLLGAMQISRDRVQFAQIKPFVMLLREGESFLMYPGASRSRSGMLVEYRDGIEEPGGVSFFLVHAQRARPDLKVAAVPLTRTYNPVNKHTTVVIGEPQFLPADADRSAQREWDQRLMVVMGESVEINVPHVVSGILYLRCLHGMKEPIECTWLEPAVTRVLDSIRGRYVDSAFRTDPQREIRYTLRYLESHGMLRVRRGRVYPDAAAILSAPPIDSSYRKCNPVKHLVNQIIHLEDVTSMLAEVAVEIAPVRIGSIIAR